MKAIFRNDPNFIDRWECFLRENEHASVFYSLRWMEYQKYYSEDRFVDDLSFVLLEPNGKPLAICPLYLERYHDVRRFSYRGEFLESLRTPILSQGMHSRHAKKVERELYKTIDDLAAEHKVAKTNFLIDPLCSIYDCERYNYLTQYGYIDASISTQIIDFRLSEEELWAEQRQSYKALTNKAKQVYETVLMDYTNPECDIHNNYVSLHHKAAGRITRPAATFDMQLEMLKNDEAILVGIKHENEFVAFSFFIHLNKTAYYASEADDPDAILPVTCGPLMQWEAMTYYKARKFNYMELDNQQYGCQIHDHPTKKDVKLSFFKRGFGGKTFPLFRGVKYYDKNLLRVELEENLNNFFEGYE